MDRRDFFKTTLAAAGIACFDGWEAAFAAGKRDKTVGKAWKGWKKGHFQVHFIYTGEGESMFIIMPDGTSMLLDCGDIDTLSRGADAVPVLPGRGRRPGEKIARYVRRVNPAGVDVDYMMLSHYHTDHSGGEVHFAAEEIRDGQPYRLSGFSQAAEYLRFDHAIDRCWPDYSDPVPLTDTGQKPFSHMRKFYDYMQKHRGLKIEKFRLGATDQIVMLNNPAAYPEFVVRNICGNGRICAEDGTVTDLLKDFIERTHPQSVPENALSLGMVFSYGPFKFFTAGDFSYSVEEADGRKFRMEDALADVCGPVQVAKINHHGHYSMPEKLVKALRAQVWVNCVWSQGHTVPAVISRLADRSLYPGDRVICPGVYPVERRTVETGIPGFADVAEASYDAGHIVLDVNPGGKSYSVSYLTAEDESMTVRSVMKFEV